MNDTLFWILMICIVWLPDSTRQSRNLIFWVFVVIALIGTTIDWFLLVRRIINAF